MFARGSFIANIVDPMRLDELLDVEHRGWQSLCDGTGAAFYGDVMTDDGVMVLAHGQVLSRQEVIDTLSEAPPWQTYEIDEERLIPVGESAAVLVYRGRASRAGQQAAFTALMSSVYVRRETGWALAVYQQTPVPG
jgi:hypothetical protein